MITDITRVPFPESKHTKQQGITFLLMKLQGLPTGS